MRAYESASDKAQHAAADDARRALTDLAREVWTLHERGALERPDAPASERARVLYLRGRLLEAVGVVRDAKGARSEGDDRLGVADLTEMLDLAKMESSPRETPLATPRRIC